MTKRITLAEQGRIIEALRLEVSTLKADLAIARAPKAPSVKPTAHWTQRPVFYVAFDKDHAFRAREAAARRLNRVVMASAREIATGRGIHTLWELR